MWVRSVKRSLQKQDTPFVVIQSWNKDIVLLPTILLSFVFSFVLALSPDPGKHPAVLTTYATLGGTWFAVFLLNWIILRFNMKILWVVILALAILSLTLVLHFMGALAGLLAAIKSWRFYLNEGVYLGLGVVFSLGIVVSWITNQFHFAVITPNETEIHTGIFGKVEKISREQTIFEKNVSDDALEKGLFRMGTIIIRVTIPIDPRTYVYENVLFVDTKDEKARDIQKEERVKLVSDGPRA